MEYVQCAVDRPYLQPHRPSRLTQGATATTFQSIPSTHTLAVKYTVIYWAITVAAHACSLCRLGTWPSSIIACSTVRLLEGLRVVCQCIVNIMGPWLREFSYWPRQLSITQCFWCESPRGHGRFIDPFSATAMKSNCRNGWTDNIAFKEFPPTTAIRVGSCAKPLIDSGGGGCSRS